MNDKQYIVVWHEENDSGVPEHNLGASPVFRSEDDAKAWIDGCICEDEARHEEWENGSDFLKDTIDGDVIRTIGNGQKVYYSIHEINKGDYR